MATKLPRSIIKVKLTRKCIWVKELFHCDWSHEIWAELNFGMRSAANHFGLQLETVNTQGQLDCFVVVHQWLVVARIRSVIQLQLHQSFDSISTCVYYFLYPVAQVYGLILMRLSFRRVRLGLISLFNVALHTFINFILCGLVFRTLFNNTFLQKLFQLLLVFTRSDVGRSHQKSDLTKHQNDVHRAVLLDRKSKRVGVLVNN